MGVLSELELAAFGEMTEGGSHAFPIDIFERSCIPILLKEGIMPF
jgi:hypothetical protein